MDIKMLKKCLSIISFCLLISVSFYGVGQATSINGGSFVGAAISSSPYLQVDSTCILYHAYWSGEATDRSNWGNSGVVDGGTFVTNGLSLDGINDHVDISGFSPNIGTNDFTVDFWVKLYFAPEGENWYISTVLFATEDTDEWPYNTGSAWEVATHYTQNPDSYYFTGSELYRQDVLTQYCYHRTAYGASTGQNVGEWVHIAIRIDRDSTDNTDAFVNAIEKNFAGGAVVDNGANNIVITTAYISKPFYVYGIIGEIRIWLKALTDQEITNIYSSTGGRYQ